MHNNCGFFILNSLSLLPLLLNDLSVSTCLIGSAPFAGKVLL